MSMVTSSSASSATGTSPLHISSIQSSTLEPQRKKKKKRKADEDGSATPDGQTSKKKKRRHRQPSTLDETEVAASIVDQQNAPTEAIPRRKKRTRTSPGTTVSQPTIDTAQEDSAQASTTAFLTAIVAAAAGALAPEASQMEPNFPPDAQHFNPPYPMQYPYPHAPFAHGVEPPVASLPFGDMAFGSNEDVLRVLHDLDISKIANVLKTLGDAAVAANLPTFAQPSFAPPSSHLPTGSDIILGRPQREEVTRGHRRTIDMNLIQPEPQGLPEHAYILANKWLNVNKLAELVKTQGLVYKKGKFSAIEEQQLKSAIEAYRMGKGLSEDQMQEIIFPKNEKQKDNIFWSEITSAVPQRPIISVYHHVRRSYHPMKQQGKWTPEEDALLKQAVTDLGQQWEKVSERVGRRSSDCRDRYRNHIINREIRITGAWSKAEEDQLTQIVTQMTIEQGKDIDNDVFWGRVSELMGGKRGRQQCRIKWTDALSKTVKNEGQKPRWSQQDAFVLVHKVDSLNVRDDTEIDWKTLSDPQWNLWSAHTLQRRWLTMKRGIKGFEDMTHHEIMDILRVKKAQMPAAPSAPRKRKERKVTSAAAIPDSEMQRDFSTAEVEA